MRWATIPAILMLLYGHSSNAEPFWKKAISFATAPMTLQADVAKRTAQAVTGNPAIGNFAALVASPTGVAIQQGAPVAEVVARGTAQYVQAAIATHDPLAIANIPNPWFIQSVLAIKGMQQAGILRTHDDCLRASQLVGQGALVGAGAIVGDRTAAELIGKLTRGFEDSACRVADRRTLSWSEFRTEILGLASATQQLVSGDLSGAPSGKYDTSIGALPFVPAGNQDIAVERFVNGLAAGHQFPMGSCTSRRTGRTGFLMSDFNIVVPDIIEPARMQPRNVALYAPSFLNIFRTGLDPTGAYAIVSLDPNNPFAVDNDGWLVERPAYPGWPPLLVGKCNLPDIGIVPN